MSPLCAALLVLATPLQSGSQPGASLPRPYSSTLHRLCEAPLRSVRPSPYGGRSVKLMLDLGAGVQALWKPRQVRDEARYQAEVAAFRLASHLGIDLVPPACERSIPLVDLERAASDPAQAGLRARIQQELSADPDGQVPGAAIFWVRKARELTIEKDWTWRRWMMAGSVIPADQAVRAADLADMLVLDLVTNNFDRFTGGNLLHVPTTDRLLLVDNNAAFRAIGSLKRPYHLEVLGYLGRARHATYFRLLALTQRDVTRIMARPGGQPGLLTPAEIAAVIQRRDEVVRHLEAHRRAHGDAAVLLP
jgi:hypothetical protein